MMNLQLAGARESKPAHRHCHQEFYQGQTLGGIGATLACLAQP
jgi:hypothetical protein